MPRGSFLFLVRRNHRGFRGLEVFERSETNSYSYRSALFVVVVVVAYNLLVNYVFTNVGCRRKRGGVFSVLAHLVKNGTALCNSGHYEHLFAGGVD